MRSVLLGAVLVAGALWARPGLAQGPVDPKFEAIRKQAEIDAKLGAHIPANTRFQDATGRELELREVLRPDRPAVVSIIYYTCPRMCNEVMNGLVKSLRDLDWNPGKEFDVIIASMDPKDTPEESALRKDHILASYGRRDTAGGWHFLTGEEAEIRRLAGALGFGYVWQDDIQEYAHSAGLFFVTPEGRLARCLEGIVFEPDDVKLALLESAEGKIGSFFDKLTMLCISWDPETGRYVPMAFNVMRIGGVVIIAGIAALFLFVRRIEKRRRAASVPGATP